ncbi:YggS family pyridoxal phosphate-dependent enzyme [Hydrogenimonas urashimensis]|uniref:YggS family pyridoxal phosphate-dependent enzyme n=1 Tax=Hydrogenimonas urashimensis TaxID=2740515 RepID=UPI0019164DEA|nr:YggS family pyridoxal phosphate-dependent enzyme [Hydrogenimonas urashimensis]
MDRAQMQKRLDQLVWRVEEARIRRSEHHIVKIVAVSKYATEEQVRMLYDLGQRAFGENRVQMLQERTEHLEDLPIEWHFIGRLQKNKINHLIRANPFMMQSLDSLELAEAMQKRLAEQNVTMECLMQINSAREESKTGVDPDEAVEIYTAIKERCPNIDLRGVMTIGAHTEEKALVRKSFETTYDIFDRLKKDGAQICSMGMSHDFELAIECGSNMIRIGSLLFK